MGTGRTSFHRARFVAPLSLLAFGVLFFRPVFSGECFFYEDVSQLFVPLRTLLGEVCRHGVPLWCSRLGNGTVLLASPIQEAIYPPSWLYAFASAHRLFSYLAVAHVLFGAIGTCLLARRLGRSTPAAGVAGAIYGFSGATISSISTSALGTTLAWIPWVVLAARRLVETRRFRARLAGFALCLGLAVLAGDPFAIGAGLAGVAMLAMSSERGWRAAPRLLAGTTLGLLLASPLIFATGRYLKVTGRGAGLALEQNLQWSFHPALALGFLVRNPFGDPTFYGLPGFWAHALDPAREQLLLPGLYLGGFALALLLAGTLSRHPERWGLLAWVGLLVFLGLGRHNPLATFLYRIPPLDGLRYPIKWIAGATLPIALLAAAGFEVLERATHDARSRRVFFAAGMSVLALLGLVSVATSLGLDRAIASLARLPGNLPAPGGPAATAFSDPRGWLADLVRSELLAGVLRSTWPLALALLFAMRWRSSWRRTRVAVLALLVGVDLWSNRHLAPTTPASFYDDVPMAARVLREQPDFPGRLFVERLDPDRLTFVRPPLFAVGYFRHERETLQHYTPVEYGLDLALHTDIEAFAPIWYTELVDLVNEAPLREKLMLSGGAGANYLATFETYGAPWLEPIASFPNRTDHPFRLYRNRLARPRARMASQLVPYGGKEALPGLLRSLPDDFFADHALIDARSPYPAPPEIEPGAPVGSAIIEADRGSELRIRTAGRGGYLVVSDTFVPGWRARLDGRPVDLFRADHAFRGVAVPAGDHVVEMTYRPW